jgi:GNAT superfamily N-acetyltransferase
VTNREVGRTAIDTVHDDPGREITIRRARTADALCIALLGTQVFLDTYATEGIRPSLAREAHETLSPNAIEALLAEPSSTILVAETNRHLVAFAHVSAHVEHELVTFASPAELKRLYVQERFTGRGLGKALLHRAEEVACADGAAGMWLAAWSGNARALRFYASQGYAELGATPFTVQGEHYENKVFAKRLQLEPTRDRPHCDVSFPVGTSFRSETEPVPVQR